MKENVNLKLYSGREQGHQHIKLYRNEGEKGYWEQ